MGREGRVPFHLLGRRHRHGGVPREAVFRGWRVRAAGWQMVRVRGGVEEGYLGEQLALQLLQLQDVLDGVLDDGRLVHLHAIRSIPFIHSTHGQEHQSKGGCM